MKRTIFVLLIMAVSILIPCSYSLAQVVCRSAEECCDKALHHFEEFDMRIQYYTKAIEFDIFGACGSKKDDGTVYSWRGLMYFYKNDYDKAIEDYNYAIELNPKYYTYNDRGIVYLNKGDYDNALEDFNSAIKLDGGSGQPRPSVSIMIRPLEYESISFEFADFFESEMRTNRGIAYSKKGDYNNAIEDYTTAINLNGYNVRAFFKRGVAYIDIGEYDKAIKDFTKAIDLHPTSNSDFNYTDCITVFDEMCEYGKWNNMINMDFNLMFKNTRAYFRRGVAYSCKSEFHKAIEDYSKAIELNPENADAYFYRGTAYSEIEEYDKTIADYNRAIVLNPDNAEAYFKRGIVYSNNGDNDKAIGDYSKAIELNPENANAYYNRGLDFDEIGDNDGAIKDFQKYLELNPDAEDRVEVLEMIGELKENKGN